MFKGESIVYLPCKRNVCVPTEPDQSEHLRLFVRIRENVLSTTLQDRLESSKSRPRKKIPFSEISLIDASTVIFTMYKSHHKWDFRRLVYFIREPSSKVMANVDRNACVMLVHVS